MSIKAVVIAVATLFIGSVVCFRELSHSPDACIGANGNRYWVVPRRGCVHYQESPAGGRGAWQTAAYRECPTGSIFDIGACACVDESVAVCEEALLPWKVPKNVKYPGA